jgi:2-(1,2-epoxy-1,2-dihydrophenyl)acetyl-CoA isomerase
VKDYPKAPEGLLIERDDAVVRLTLDRPERRNALTDDIVHALTEAIEAAGSDEAARVIVLTGKGDHFCSGFDLGQRAAGAQPERPRAGSIQRRMRYQVNRLIPTMLETQVPIVTAARGWIVGLGLNLVLASDFAFVADDARLWAPFTELGFTPDSGASWLIPRLAGVARAKEMLLLARKITGADAAAWGLVHRALPGAHLDAAAAALAGELAVAPTVAVGLSKLLLHRGLATDLDHHLADEAFAMEVSTRSEDFAELNRAKREGRDPHLGGR